MAQDYEVYQGDGRWYVQAEGAPAPCGRERTKRAAIALAVKLTAGVGQVRVRNPKTGRYTDESR